MNNLILLFDNFYQELFLRYGIRAILTSTVFI
nr:MAG TPA: hypothetical protein [Caudoviricetes sp.]